MADEPANYVYDLKADVERPARDIFVRTCDSAGADCADPVNISNTAAKFSIATDWTGDTDGSAERTPFYGDSGKPNIFASGNRVVITWVDAYCPGAENLPTAQRTVTYLERKDREVPFRCVYAAHASVTVDTPVDWATTQLSDGSRDANQDVSRGMQNGGWAVIWQEDPRGLQPGEAEGPGDGASGARASLGTNGVPYSTADADAASDSRKSAVATVYSRCARLTIQKLVGTRENPGLLAWNPELGQWTGDIEPPDFNRGVWEAGKGPGGYSAEINVRGRLICGYTGGSRSFTRWTRRATTV